MPLLPVLLNWKDAQNNKQAPEKNTRFDKYIKPGSYNLQMLINDSLPDGNG